MPASTGYLARLYRLVHPGRNPLARSWDRAEGYLLLALIIGVLVAVPFAVTRGSSAEVAGMRTVESEAGSRHRATAMLLQDAPVPPMASSGGVQTARTPAQWQLPDGSVRQGTVPVQAGLPRGTKVGVWLDGSGSAVSAPRTAGWATGQGIAAGGMFWLAVVFGGAVVFVMVRRVLGRFRMREWDREWERADRQWSGS
ncbi:hypothetical protein ABZ863_04690 [Saccharomonospora sp. NPDC046836]|uniref:Rv1733c family protein n=1 Tax=Saccharomonospora sp. NPDC046836 TaxID=3156921 RepID=UPI0033EA26F3